jgi:hypothetical protein
MSATADSFWVAADLKEEMRSSRGDACVKQVKARTKRGRRGERERAGNGDGADGRDGADGSVFDEVWR